MKFYVRSGVTSADEIKLKLNPLVNADEEVPSVLVNEVAPVSVLLIVTLADDSLL